MITDTEEHEPSTLGLNGDDSLPPEDFDEATPKDDLAGDTVEQGILKNLPQFQDDLRWGWRYGVDHDWTQADMAREWGVSESVISKLFNGKYTHPKTGLILPPPTILLARIRELREVEAERARKRGDRVMTPTVRKIWHLAHKISGRDTEGQPLAEQRRLMGFVFGESHIGKTEALMWYRESFNHGKTIYVDLQGINGIIELYREFAKALRLDTEDRLDRLKARVIKAINRDTLIICDELHHITYAFKKTSAKSMINALKSIKDRTHCAMLLCGTYVAQYEIDEGHEAKLLVQLKRRAASRELHLPKAIPVYDMRVIAGSRGLPFPAAPSGKGIRLDPFGIARRRQRDAKGEIVRVNVDTWEAIGKAVEGTDMADAIEMLDSIAHEHGIEALFTQLDDAKLLAEHAGRPVAWDDVLDAWEINMGLKAADNT